MNRTKRASLALLLALVFCLLAIPAAATETPTVQFVFSVDGETRTYQTVSATDGKVLMPEAPALTSGFVGWTAEVGGETVLLPSGAYCEGISEDTVFTAVCTDFTTDTGCSVRLLDEDVALRFTSSLSAESYHTLTTLLGGEDKVSFGTYIVPRSYIQGNVFTLEALEENAENNNIRHQYLDVEAHDFYKKTDTTLTIAGSIGHILPDHMSLVYSGVGYMKVTYTNGYVGTVYAKFNRVNNSRSVTKVVLTAYETRGESYENLIIEDGVSTHSPYTYSELELCREFLDNIVLIGHGFEGEYYVYYVLQTKYYHSPWTVSSTINQTTDIATITVTPPAGRTVAEIEGIYINGLWQSLKQTRIEDGVLRFERGSDLGPH